MAVSTDAAADADKPKRRTRTTKKADEPVAEAAASTDTEAEKPKRRTRTKKATDPSDEGIGASESPY